MIIELSISEKNGYFDSKYKNNELDIHAFHPSEYEHQKGVYIWAIEYNSKKLVYYIGKTDRTFKKEINGTWVSSYKKGKGNVNNPKKFKNGIRDNIFPCDIDYLGRKTNNMGSKNYKIFWSQIWKPKWDSNNNKIKEKLCEMLNCIEIYYIPVEDDLNIEPECLESTLGLNLFNSEDDLVSKFINENDFGSFLQSNKKFQTNYIKDRVVEIKNHERFYGIPKNMICPYNYINEEINDYFSEMLDLLTTVNSLNRR